MASRKPSPRTLLARFVSNGTTACRWGSLGRTLQISHAPSGKMNNNMNGNHASVDGTCKQPASPARWLWRLVRPLRRWINAVTSDEGCTMVDARKLRYYNHGLAADNERLRWLLLEARECMDGNRQHIEIIGENCVVGTHHVLDEIDNALSSANVGYVARPAADKHSP